MSGRWRRTASATALALLVATLVVLALRYDGKPFTEVELNDGGVWVTNREDGLVARLNPQIKELDLGLDSGSATFDIFQRAANLFVDDFATARSVKPVDIPRAAVLEPTNLPTGARVAHGGDTFAVVDPTTGRAWVRPADGIQAFSPKAAEPDATDALTAAVGTDGRAYVLGRDGTVTPFRLEAGGVAVADDDIELADEVGTDPGMVALTVVGDSPVLFDRTTSQLSRPGADPVRVEAADPSSVELQLPSERGDEVYVATADALHSTPLDGGDLVEVSSGDRSGAPAAPVVLTGARCVYAAWADPDGDNYLRDCADDGDDDTERIRDMQGKAELQFRVNREVVVLNDTFTGDAWLVQEPGKAKIDNWPQVDPKNENRSRLKETTEELPEQENRPPEPQDDDLGARRGRSTVLPVVALNDHDPDGDIISIAKTQHVSGPELEVKIVGGGTQIQVTVPAEAEGPARFRYYVTDGRVREEVYATVTLQIRADDASNRKPQAMEDRTPQLTVARGATTSHYLLADFYDLDGDDLTLTDASARGGEVEFRPDGTITFTDTGDEVTEIQYTISDGFDEVVGKLPVDRVGETAPPELVPDLASGVAGNRVVVQPLTNDRNPEGRELTLKSVKVVGNDAGTQISKDLESGTFTFRSAKAKSYYLEYSAHNSSATRTSLVRLDIESPPKDNRPPVAVGDKAVITPGGTAQVDLLLNDLDPDGDVLSVTRVHRPSVPGVKVSVVDKRLAVVSSATDIIGQQATVEYVLSDGRSSTVGHLVVAQRQATRANRHPVANKDQVTVRAGSVTSIPVLANDSDPDGPKPRLIQDELQNPQGLPVWVAGDSLRLRAPEEPGSYSVIYGVRDEDGFKASAEVAIYVVADSARNNHAPLPQPIIDRVISGRSKVVSVDLVGADPDGDSVVFRGVLTAPRFGRVLDTGLDWIRYEAFEGKAGTDFFQIRVQDKYGATGVADVRIGVVPQEAENQPPVALDDNILVQPNRTITYNVLTNDIDPDDDPLRIDELTTTADARHDHGFVEVAVGDAPEQGTADKSIGYTIRDAAGAEDHALLEVSTSRTAPFYAPIARDDVAELGDIIGREPGETVEVPVLDNDLDFDGAKADLEVVGCDAGSKGRCEVRDETVVEVTLKAHDQVVLYRLADAEEDSPDTFGVVFVTGTDNVPPQLTTDEDLVPVRAVAGQPVVLDLRDLVVTRAGREPAIVPDSLPTAVNGAVSPVDDAPTSLSFTPTRGHVGPASVTVEVSDGRTAAEDAALTSLLTVPIDVEPATNVAPTMRDSAVDVTRSGDAAEVDLAGLTEDANDGDLDSMGYSVKSVPSGLDARIAEGGSVLSIRAAGGAEDGDVLRVAVLADDGRGGTAEAVVSARVVGTDLPLLQVSAIDVTATLDEETSVDVADATVNPYPDPIRLSDPRIESGGRLSGLEVDGSVVRFTPTGSGTSTIRVTVSDASGDRTRDVPARITVTVVDRPEAPGRPAVSSVEASSAVLSWNEPESNGADITSYEVSGSHGFEQTCPATTCRLDGLSPGDSYEFTVRAVNSEGRSAPSPPSETVEPNRAPGLMSPPTIVVESAPTGSRMDRQLTVRWTPPENEGSPITEYEIKEAGSGRTWSSGGETTSRVIPGLTNGTPYAFEIRAVNEVEPRQQYSAPSRAEQPFGVPLPSGAAPHLTASEADSFASRPWVSIDWSAWSDSQSNGDPVSSYTITCRGGCRQSTYTVDASVTSRTFNEGDGIEKGETVTFTVAASNRAGRSGPSPSVSGRPWTRASPVRNLREVGSSPDNLQARIGWDPPADDGGLAVHHYVISDGSGWSDTVPSAPGPGGTTVTFPANGSHTVRVWAVTYNGDRAVEGETASISGVETWGRPERPPDGSATSNDHYRVALTLSAGAANGKPVTGIQYRFPGGQWVDASSGFAYREDVPEGGSQRILEVRTVSEAADDRRYSAVTTMTGTSLAKYLDIATRCNNNLDRCAIEVHGNGFNNQRKSVARVDPAPGTAVADGFSCTWTTEVDARFDTWSYGGADCRVTLPGHVAIDVDGVQRRNH